MRSSLRSRHLKDTWSSAGQPRGAGVRAALRPRSGDRSMMRFRLAGRSRALTRLGFTRSSQHPDRIGVLSWQVEVGGGMPTLDLIESTGRYLSMAEREEIAILRAQVGVREIARRRKRSPATISRELRRNASGGQPSRYRATVAQAEAEAGPPTQDQQARGAPAAARLRPGQARWSTALEPRADLAAHRARHTRHPCSVPRNSVDRSHRSLLSRPLTTRSSRGGRTQAVTRGGLVWRVQAVVAPYGLGDAPRSFLCLDLDADVEGDLFA